MPSQPVSNQEIAGLNKLLSDILRKEVRLSSILADLGFTEQQIETVKKRFLRETVDLVLATLKEFIFARSDSERIWHILCERYGLKGNHPNTLQKLGKDFGISQEQVRQLEGSGIRKLSLPRRKRILIESIHSGVSEHLNCSQPLHSDAITKILSRKENINETGQRIPDYFSQVRKKISSRLPTLDR